jgi:hypothetical protein
VLKSASYHTGRKKDHKAGLAKASKSSSTVRKTDHKAVVAKASTCSKESHGWQDEGNTEHAT